MQATWSKILVPVTVVGLALLETLGFDSRRPESHVSSYSAVRAVSKEEIMISPEDTTKKKKTPPPWLPVEMMTIFSSQLILPPTRFLPSRRETP